MSQPISSKKRIRIDDSSTSIPKLEPNSSIPNLEPNISPQIPAPVPVSNLIVVPSSNSSVLSSLSPLSEEKKIIFEDSVFNSSTENILKLLQWVNAPPHPIFPDIAFKVGLLNPVSDSNIPLTCALALTSNKCHSGTLSEGGVDFKCLSFILKNNDYCQSRFDRALLSQNQKHGFVILKNPRSYVYFHINSNDVSMEYNDENENSPSNYYKSNVFISPNGNYVFLCKLHCYVYVHNNTRNYRTRVYLNQYSSSGDLFIFKKIPLADFSGNIDNMSLLKNLLIFNISVGEDCALLQVAKYLFYFQF